MFARMSLFLENFLLMQQCSFREGHSTRHCILALLGKWKCAFDTGKVFGTLLTDMSKAFDCLDHELVITKPNAHGSSLPALKLIHNNFSSRKQRTKVNNTDSSWSEIIFGVPKSLILGSLLFSVFLGDLLFHFTRCRSC